MVINHALRLACGPGRVIEAKALPFVADEVAIVDRCHAPVAKKSKISGDAVLGKTEKTDTRLRRRGRGHRGGLAVREDHAAFGMFENVAHARLVKSDIDRVEHGSHHRHGKMRRQHFGTVRAHDRHHVAGRDVFVDQKPGHPHDDVVEARIGPSSVAPDHGRSIRKRRDGPVEKIQRRQRLVVCRARREMRIIAHAVPPFLPPTVRRPSSSSRTSGPHRSGAD